MANQLLVQNTVNQSAARTEHCQPIASPPITCQYRTQLTNGDAHWSNEQPVQTETVKFCNALLLGVTPVELGGGGLVVKLSYVIYVS